MGDPAISEVGNLDCRADLYLFKLTRGMQSAIKYSANAA